MRAEASVVAEARPGGSRCTTLRSSPPLTFRATPSGLHLVGTAAGPVGGDELRLRLTVAAGASLTVRSVAAQLVLPAPRPAVSTMQLEVEVAPGASLRWLPEPMVIVDGAEHRVATTIRLAAGASLVWRDEVVLGRDGEAGGSLLTRLRVERDGRPLLCTEVALGPAWPGASGPAGTGDARVLASALLVGARSATAASAHQPERHEERARAACFALADDAVLLTTLSESIDAARAALARIGCPKSDSSGLEN